MGFFKRLFGPGQAKIAGWMSQPREYPDLDVSGVKVKDIPAGDPRWVVSREYADPEKPSLRKYLGAVKALDGWDIRLYTFNSKMPEGQRLVGKELVESADTPEGVIAYMRRYEITARENKWLPAKQTKSSVINFANHFGLHVDGDGRVVDVKNNQMGSGDNVFITRGSLNALFNGKGLAENRKYSNIDNWESLYRDLVNAVPHNEITLDAMVADPAWERFEAGLRRITTDLTTLPAFFMDTGNLERHRRGFLAKLLGEVDIAGDFASKEKRETAAHIVDSAFLVTFLRLASGVYQREMESGLTREGMAVVKKTGELVRQLVAKRFAVDSQTAKKIESIMTQGKDPYGPGLFTDIILEQVSDAKARVAAAEKERKAEEARLALIEEDRRLAEEKAAREAEANRIAEEKAKEEAAAKMLPESPAVQAPETDNAVKADEKPAEPGRKEPPRWNGFRAGLR